jgi:hypothetical protein
MQSTRMMQSTPPLVVMEVMMNLTHVRIGDPRVKSKFRWCHAVLRLPPGCRLQK